MDTSSPDLPTLTLPTLALAALAAALPEPRSDPAWTSDMLPGCVAAIRRRPRGDDKRLVAVADALGLDDAELLAVALCMAADRDAQTARALAEAQGPLGGSRPMLGFLANALAPLGGTTAALGCGSAVSSGLLRLGDETAALPERSVAIPLPILAALTGRTMPLEGVRPLDPRTLHLPPAVITECEARAAMMRGRERAGLILRTANPADGQAIAGRIAEALGLKLARIEQDPPPSLAPWLVAAGRMPLFNPVLAPGQRWTVPYLGPFRGPWIVAPGLDGSIDTDEPADEWTPPVPDIDDRTLLWQANGISPSIARQAAERFRHGAGRIAEVASRAQLAASRRGASEPSWADITDGVARGAASLDALARRGDARVDDDALVLPLALREGLERLLDRARVRCTLDEALGPAVRSRYRPGVRALMVGESGTGKTLAAHWLATRLGLPLYRVDLAALTSKFIGETEKNLSAILSAAEHADVLLFFDEADSLFGSRTEVGDAHDRYANAQTNYLLQRIEEFDGIAVLASNSRDRFDPAFSRRLDAILEFPMPEGPARRDLWVAHMGDRHSLTAADFDRLAVSVDMAGGHIRNIVLTAAARARSAGRPIAWCDLVPSTREEYGKLGRPAPDLGPC